MIRTNQVNVFCVLCSILFGSIAIAELPAQSQQSTQASGVDIRGVDLDGVSFNLSDYRGKVVFLDFWGDW